MSKKILYFSILFLGIITLSACNNPNTNKTNTCWLSGNSCQIPQNTKNKKLNFKVIKWNYTWNLENIKKITKIFNDLNSIENAYSFLTTQKAKKELICNDWSKIIVKSWSVYLYKNNKKTKLIWQNNKDSVNAILWIDANVVWLYWPFVNVFASWDKSFIYANKTIYWDNIKFEVFSLTKKQKILPKDLLLYYTQNNDSVITTTQTNNWQYSYSWLIIYKNWNKNIVLTWWFDWFAYNWLVLYAYKTVDFDNELSDVYSIKLKNLKVEKLLTKKPIWQQPRFFISNWKIYISFGIINFASEKVSHHIAAYDYNTKKLLREIELND